MAVRFARAIHVLSDLEGSHSIVEYQPSFPTTEPLVDRFLHRSRRLRDPLYPYPALTFAIQATHYVNQYYASEDVDADYYRDELARSVIKGYLWRLGDR